MVKTVRARKEAVLRLVREDPAVKVLHLIRDPRGRLLSMRETFGTAGNAGGEREVDEEEAEEEEKEEDGGILEDVLNSCRYAINEMEALQRELTKER